MLYAQQTTSIQGRDWRAAVLFVKEHSKNKKKDAEEGERYTPPPNAQVGWLTDNILATTPIFLGSSRYYRFLGGWIPPRVGGEWRE
jgi:hypothetical protein